MGTFLANHPNTTLNHINNARYRINGPSCVDGMVGNDTANWPCRPVDIGIHKTHYAQVASSAHKGGAHFLMGDGAVRFLSESMDYFLYSNLTRMDTGLPVGEF
jgi:prepilin-type processing-associated H-X9-DG protein